jgi:hypothetical protein
LIWVSTSLKWKYLIVLYLIYVFHILIYIFQIKTNYNKERPMEVGWRHCNSNSFLFSEVWRDCCQLKRGNHRESGVICICGVSPNWLSISCAPTTVLPYRSNGYKIQPIIQLPEDFWVSFTVIFSYNYVLFKVYWTWWVIWIRIGTTKSKK